LRNSTDAEAPRPLPAASTEPAWRDPFARARYKEALAAIEAEDLTRVCVGEGAQDLLAIADVARYAGRPERAEIPLREARRRFPGSVEAATAAFQLGRIAFDDRARFAEAASWFATYLAEAPHGGLRREAFGRLVEARERAGDHPGATDAARRYLDAYPTGPHADLARKVLRR
jgi:hypothetical protein